MKLIIRSSAVLGLVLLALLLLDSLGFPEWQEEATVTLYSSAAEHEGKPNHLIDEKSPYLLQHAYNPVDWYPWGEEAFEKALQEEKPIFLSVGYSTCHWCHVMERESFSSSEVAAFLNRHFVSIKVDREERPDVDMVYMRFIQAITQRGGWPMSVFLTPELKPFFGGIYFPPQNFMALLSRVNDEWQNNRQAILASAVKSIDALNDLNDSTGAANLTLEMKLLDRTHQWYVAAYDSKQGGFHSAEDADSPINHASSEHAEGAYYVWSHREIVDLLGENAVIFNHYYGVKKDGNVEEDHFGEFKNKNVLHISTTVGKTAEKFGKSADEINELLEQGRVKLFKVRANRPH